MNDPKLDRIAARMKGQECEDARGNTFLILMLDERPIELAIGAWEHPCGGWLMSLTLEVEGEEALFDSPFIWSLN